MTLSEQHHALVDALIERRKALGISRDGLGLQIGTNGKHVWEWETRKFAPRLGSLLRWCRALGMQVSVAAVPTKNPAVQGRGVSTSNNKVAHV